MTAPCECERHPCVHDDRLPFVFDGIAMDLAAIAEDLGWNHALGWDVPTGVRSAADGRRRGGVHLEACECDPQPCAVHADRVAGAERDPGVGMHASRSAVRRAMSELARGVEDLARSVAVFHPSSAMKITVDANAGLAAHRLLVRLAQDQHRRASEILLAVDERRRPRAATDAIAHAYKRIHGAAGLLARPLAKLDQQPVVESIDVMCTTCRKQPRAANTGGRCESCFLKANNALCAICCRRPRGAKSGKRCKTCEGYKVRNGRERPRSLDGDDVKDARQAQQRRRLRGEGWGVA